MKTEELSDRLWNFAARIGKVVDALPDTRLGRHVAGQLVRCGTSAPPNYDEGSNAESRADFIHKLSVALKELSETRGWLRFTVKAELQTEARIRRLIDECNQLCRILGKSVATAKAVTSRRSGDAPRETIANYQLPITSDQFPLFAHLDHVAIVVKDTEEALKFYRDKLGLPLLFSEVLEEQNVRLTHLDMGNLDLQLVQPLKEDHPLTDYLDQRGEGLHHLCFRVDNLEQTVALLPLRNLFPRDQKPRRGPRGRQAAFIDPQTTNGILLEITADRKTAG